ETDDRFVEVRETDERYRRFCGGTRLVSDQHVLAGILVMVGHQTAHAQTFGVLDSQGAEHRHATCGDALAIASGFQTSGRQLAASSTREVVILGIALGDAVGDIQVTAGSLFEGICRSVGRTRVAGVMDETNRLGHAYYLLGSGWKVKFYSTAL